MYYSSKIWEKSSWSVSRHRMDTKEEYVQAIIDSMSNFGSSEKVMAEYFLSCDEEATSNWGGNSDDYLQYVYKRLMRIDFITLTFILNGLTYAHDAKKVYDMKKDLEWSKQAGFMCARVKPRIH